MRCAWAAVKKWPMALLITSAALLHLRRLLIKRARLSSLDVIKASHCWDSIPIFFYFFFVPLPFVPVSLCNIIQAVSKVPDIWCSVKRTTVWSRLQSRGFHPRWIVFTLMRKTTICMHASWDRRLATLSFPLCFFNIAVLARHCVQNALSCRQQPWPLGPRCAPGSPAGTAFEDNELGEFSLATAMASHGFTSPLLSGQQLVSSTTIFHTCRHQLVRAWRLKRCSSLGTIILCQNVKHGGSRPQPDALLLSQERGKKKRNTTDF